jgi:starch synthase
MAVAAGVATGVQFQPPSVGALEAALRRTASLYADRPAWERMQANGMACDVSWGASAKLYAQLYAELLQA